MRSLIGKGFTPSKVAQMEDRIRAIAVEHLDAALERGICSTSSPTSPESCPWT